MLQCIERDNKCRIINSFCPVQVKFWNSYEVDEEDEGDKGSFMGGILVDDYIICGCCGGMISLTDIYEAAEADGFKDVMEVIEPLEWIDISEEIKGE